MKKVLLIMVLLVSVVMSAAVVYAKTQKSANSEKREMDVVITSSSSMPVTGWIVVSGQTEEMFGPYTVSSSSPIQLRMLLEEGSSVSFDAEVPAYQNMQKVEVTPTE